MPERDWTVLLIGGASRIGKTTLSLELAKHFDVRAVEGDLFFWLLRANSTPEAEPDLHVFGQPGIWDTSPEYLTSALFSQARRVTPSASGVIARQARIGEPLIIEAIWVLPEFAAQATFDGQE
jgi:2-phosphoglycerate kinase